MLICIKKTIKKMGHLTCLIFQDISYPVGIGTCSSDEWLPGFIGPSPSTSLDKASVFGIQAIISYRNNMSNYQKVVFSLSLLIFPVLYYNKTNNPALSNIRRRLKRHGQD
jgi:hypothetical protein